MKLKSNPLAMIALACLTLIQVTTVFASGGSAAGGVGGGGGKALVCASQSGQTVELLDLWEARTLRQQIPISLGPDLASAVDASLVALKNSYRFNFDSPVCKDQDCLLLDLRTFASHFLTPYSKLTKLHGVNLTLTNDSYETVIPAGCEPKQIVNYQPDGTILMDQDLFEQMSPIDQAALIAHEAFYAFLRGAANETDSIRTRRAIGFVTSGQQFSYKKYQPPQKYLVCSADGLVDGRTAIVIDTSGGASDVYLLTLNGSNLIDIDPKVPHTTWAGAASGSIMSRTCSKDGMFFEYDFMNFSGVVEFGRIVKIEWLCKNRKLTAYMTNQKPGSPAPVAATELNCIPQKWK